MAECKLKLKHRRENATAFLHLLAEEWRANNVSEDAIFSASKYLERKFELGVEENAVTAKSVYDSGEGL